MPERADDKLQGYRAKRDFARTAEPSGAPAATDAGSEARFVVQEHHATALHWDLRLERDSVLVSWAVPKGIPPDKRVNHLAVQTEDHPLEYLDFEAVIPEGNFGAGVMKIWDRGTYLTEKWEPGEIIVVLHGERMTGRYALIHTRGKDWLLHRMDPPVDPGRELIPTDLRPMLPVDGELPEPPDDWAFQPDWGGLPVVCAFEGGRPVSCHDAEGLEVAGSWPELSQLGGALGSLAVVLSGQVIVTGDEGRPDTAWLNERLGAASPSSIRRLAGRHPATFMIDDLIWLDGHSAMQLAWKQRRRLLDELELAGPRWRSTPAHVGDGAAFMLAIREQGLPGLIAKQVDSPYLPGERSPWWVRVRAGTTEDMR